MTPDHQDFWFLPLGGCGEIGMNLNLYGHDGQWLMVDCGVTFDLGYFPRENFMAIATGSQGEPRAALSRLARDAGVPRQLTGRNGDLFFIAPVKGMRRAAVATGRLGWDRDALIPVTDAELV